MAVADHLVDKSAWARLVKPAVAQVVLPLLSAGRLAVCGMTELEVLYSVHYDRDFDVIAEVTGQTVEWVVPAGTVD